MRKAYRDERGTVLIAAMVILAFLVVITAASLHESVTKSKAVETVSTSRQSFLIAESALDTAIAELNQYVNVAAPPTSAQDGIIGTDGWTASAGDTEPDFGDTGVVPVHLSGYEYFTHVVSLGSDSVDNDGDGETDELDEKVYIKVLAKTRMIGQDEVRAVEAVLKSVATPTHPIFTQDYCIYVGNREQRESDYDEFTLEAGGEEHYWRCSYCGQREDHDFECWHNVNCVRRSWFSYRCSVCGRSSRSSFTCFHNRDYVCEVGGNCSDFLAGQIHVNGDLTASNGAQVADLDGDGNLDNEVSATGTITGLNGGASNADEILPPDIGGMDYLNTADYIISMSGGNAPSHTVTGHNTLEGACDGTVTTYPENDPRHIFAGPDYRSDLGGLESGATNDNFFLVDVQEGYHDGNISITEEGNDAVYFIDGNLHLDQGEYHSRFYNTPEGGARITIVVRGNIYVGDDFWLGCEGNMPSGVNDPPPTTDYPGNGLALIAITDGESYTDINNNNQYDDGEPILNDDGVPGYQGCSEGSGNVFYGDTNAGPVGHSQVFFYAENNFDDFCLNTDGSSLEFGIQGLMSAGNQLRINRDFGDEHAPMTVLYDGRLSSGSISLPGLPRVDGVAGSDAIGPWAVVSWRERLATGPWM